jgi:hypothetical protein
MMRMVLSTLAAWAEALAEALVLVLLKVLDEETVVELDTAELVELDTTELKVVDEAELEELTADEVEELTTATTTEEEVVVTAAVVDLLVVLVVVVEVMDVEVVVTRPSTTEMAFIWTLAVPPRPQTTEVRTVELEPVTVTGAEKLNHLSVEPLATTGKYGVLPTRVKPM